MSNPYTAVSRRCFRVCAPAILLMAMGGIAAANADLPVHLDDVPRPPVITAPPPPAPPPPAFSFASPLPGHEVGSPFGLRRLPWEPTGRLHQGVDIAAPGGVAVLATSAGVVTRTGVSLSYGRFVEVAHTDGFSSFYAHLGRVAKGLRAGQAVAMGQAVGSVGDTGHSTGDHLHFELRKDSKPLNPEMFLGQSFATAANLPLQAAAHVSRSVRLAQVSSSPDWALASADTPRRAGRGRPHAVLSAAD